MKKQFAVVCLLIFAFSLAAAPVDFVSQRATGTTSAAVIFSPGPNFGALVVADVTSDKAASVLSWQVGNTNVSLLAPATATDTNLFTTIVTIASNASCVSATSSGTVTAHNAWTTSLITNALLTLENPFGTNIAAGSLVREVTSTSLDIVSATSTNVVSILASTATNALAVGTNFVFQGMPGQVITNQVLSWVTNGGNFDITLSNNWTFIPQKFFVMSTNLYTVPFAKLAADNSIVVTNATGLIATDNIIVLNATGGGVLRQIQSTNTYRFQLTPIKAVTGVALAAGDQLFVLDTAHTTPVGAATVRLNGNPIRIIPPGVPAVLSVDGTSACAVNSATVQYR